MRKRLFRKSQPCLLRKFSDFRIDRCSFAIRQHFQNAPDLLGAPIKFRVPRLKWHARQNDDVLRSFLPGRR